MDMTPKKAWQKPELEVLDVHRTMASTVYGPVTDEAYVEGEDVDPADPESWRRFIS